LRKRLNEFTAAGPVQDLHLIPFSSRSRGLPTGTPKRATNIE